jgi:hypothetical protein
MRKNVLIVMAVTSLLALDSGTAFAQITESDKDYVPGMNETTQLITSSFEVRRAVIGLLVIAGLSLLSLSFYWYKTGQLARENFLEEHGEDALKNKKESPQRIRNLAGLIKKTKNKSLFPPSTVEGSEHDGP